MAVIFQAMKVKVHTLEAELCSVEVEPGCTGRQLKEAIEEATGWVELVCTQCLAIGVNAVPDDEVISFDGQEAVVMMTRRPLPAKVLIRPSGEAEENQRKALALAMRRFASSPVVLEVPWHGMVFGSGQEEVEAIYRAQSEQLQKEDRGDMKFDHKALNSETVEECLPWKYVAGVAPDDIVALLALQSSCMIIGDGHSFAAAVLLLKDGRLLAATASIHEASEIVSYGTIVVSATFYADSCEELFEALPSFAQAMSEATSPNWLRLSDQPLQIVDLQRPWSVKVHGADLGSWVACGWWPQDTERFNIQRSGLHLPAAEFVPKFPLALQKAFSELSETRSELQKATNKVLSACCPLKGKGRGGRGKGKEGKEGYGGQIQNERPFSEAMSIFKAHLETLSPLPLELSKETPSRLIKDYLANLESIEAPESINYDFMALVGKCFKTWETDVVFGIGKTCSESL